MNTVCSATENRRLIPEVPYPPQHDPKARGLRTSSPVRLTEAQYDALDDLCAKVTFQDVRPDLRRLGDDVFVSFTVPAKTLACVWKHRYLIHPDGEVEFLPSKVIERTI